MPAISRLQIYGQIEKVQPLDDGTIMVHGIASTEDVDSTGEIVRADAMRAALPEYMRFPAIREMHQLSAAGSAVEAEVGEDGVTRIVAHVVDSNAISKVKNNTYRGFSIGGKVTKRNPDDRKIIEGISLSEISLVDRPANPHSVLEMWKADAAAGITDDTSDTAPHSREEPMTTKTDGGESVEKTVEPAPINPTKLVDVLNDAQASMDTALNTPVAGKHVDPALPGGSTAAAVEVPNPEEAGQATPAPLNATDVPAVEHVAGETPKPGKDTRTKKAAEPEAVSQEAGTEAEAEVEVTEKAEEADPVAVARAAADNALKAATAVLSRLSKQATGISPVLAPGAELRKSLCTVSSLGYLLSELAYVLASAKYEQEFEGDNSPVPEKLHAALQSLAAAYKAMSDEELQELLDAADKTMGGQIALAAAGGDVAKALDGVVGADALSKVAGSTEHDALVKAEGRIGSLESEREELLKTVGGLTETLDTLSKRVEELAEQPLPPKTVAKTELPAGIAPLTKAEDTASAPAATEAPAGQMSIDDVRKALDSMSEEDRANTLLKAALNPANARFLKR